MRQRSGFSPVLFLIIGLIVALALKGGAGWSSIVVAGLVCCFFLALYFTTVYTITDNNQLVVQCGFIINEKIDIASIGKIVNTRTLMAAPAFSFDRMLISYGKDSGIVISPKDKKAFLNTLKTLNADIVIEGY